MQSIHTVGFLPALVGLLVPTAALAIDRHPTDVRLVNDACHQVVHTTETFLVRRRYSRAVITRWKQWGKGHPDWVKRHQHDKPKMEVRTEDGSALIGADCTLPVDAEGGGLLPPIPGLDLITFPGPDLTTSLLIEEAPPTLAPPPLTDTDTATETPYTPGLPPVFFGPNGGGYGAPSPVVLSPILPVLTPAPEPGTLLLVLTGCMATWVYAHKSKAQKCNSPTA